MSFMAQLPGKKRRTIATFGGVNRAVSPFDIKDGECTDMSGLDTYAYPQLASAREPGEAEFSKEGAGEQTSFFLKRVTNGQVVLAVDGHRYIYDTKNKGFKFYYKSYGDFKEDKKTLTELTELIDEGGKSDALKFNEHYMTTAWDDRNKKYYLNYSSVHSSDIKDESWGQTLEYEKTDLYMNNVTMKTEVEANYMTAHQFRIYTASLDSSKMNYCAQNKPTDWKTAGDAGEIEVITYDGENGSAITTFGGVVIYFKNHSMHEFYGSTAANGRLVMMSGSIGCMSHHSIQEVGARLYWLGDDAIYCYDGGKVPRDISEPIKDYLKNLNYTECSAATDGRRYIIKLLKKDGSGKVLAFDTALSIWTVLSDTAISAMTSGDGKIYGIIYGGGKTIEVKNLFECEHKGPWHWESKYFAASSPSKKQNLRSVTVLYQKPTEAQLYVSVTANNGQKYEGRESTYESVGIGDQSFIQKTKIILPQDAAHHIDWFKLRLEGVGSIRIHGIETEQRERGGTW